MYGINKINCSFNGLEVLINKFNRINVIVGKNGSGKTRLFQVIQNCMLSSVEFSEQIQICFDDLLKPEYLSYGLKTDDYHEYECIDLSGIKAADLEVRSKSTYDWESNEDFEKQHFGGNALSGFIEDVFKHLGLENDLLWRGADDSVQNVFSKIKGQTFTRHLSGRVDEKSMSDGTIEFINLAKKLFVGFVGMQELTGQSLNDAVINQQWRSNSKYKILLIEEPERGLHPAIHKKLIDFICFCCDKLSVDSRYQIFISTHSQFLVKSALSRDDAVIIHLDNSKLVKVLDKKELVSDPLMLGFDGVLTDLGFSLSDVYLPNCIVMVEGPTDILYIEYWLSKYFADQGLQIRRGINYDLIQFGGALAAHLAFHSTADGSGLELDEMAITKKFVNVYSINRKCFFVIDRDEGRNSFSKAKGYIAQNVGCNNLYCEYDTIECLIPRVLQISSDQKKVPRAIINVKNWIECNCELDKFNPGVNALVQRLTAFILSANS